jgi:hypothetical protein
MHTHTLSSENRYERRTADKDVHFVVTKRTADDFSLLSYTVHCYPGIELVSWCSMSEMQIMEAFLQILLRGLVQINHMHYVVAELDFSLH